MILAPTIGILNRLTDADSETLTLTEVKAALHITETADHDFLLSTITAVRQATEQYIEQTLINSSYTFEIDSFPLNGLICLPMGPIRAISSVQYYDDDDALQTVNSTNYEFDRNGRLRAVSTFEWPSTYDRLSAVIVAYTAGKTHSGNVDDDIKHAMKLMVGHFERNRENTITGTIIKEIPIGYRHLLNAHRFHKA